MVLPREHRLRGRFLFDRLYQKSRRFHGDWMVLRTMAAEPALLVPTLQRQPASPYRCAVVVSNKVSKKSVRRNALRRLLHPHLVRCGAQIKPGPQPLWVLLSLKPGSAEVAAAVLLEECSQLFEKAGLR